MIEFVLSDPDVVDVRFAVSPLNEVTLSLRALNDPGGYPLHRRWIRRAHDVLDRLDRPVLNALTNERGWTPDFLSPRPRSPLTRIEDELDALRLIDPEVVQRDLRSIHPHRPPDLAGPPALVLERIVTALENYWLHTLSTSWNRMRTLLEADIVHRGRAMTQAGLSLMLAGISDRIRFDSPIVQVRIDGIASRRIETKGAGLMLLPTVFARHTAVPIDPAAPPMLIYAARGVATLWERSPVKATSGLTAVLGEVRAGMLTALKEPVSSTEVARRSAVTTSAANQHLRALRAAGLLTSYRSGRSVLYTRTELGEALVAFSDGETDTKRPPHGSVLVP